jgi:hypothetical protein
MCAESICMKSSASTRNPHSENTKGYFGQLKSFLDFPLVVIKRVMASEITRYLAIYMAILLLALVYHYIGLWYFFPPDTKFVTNTDPPSAFCFRSAEYKLHAYERHTLKMVGHLMVPVVLFFLGVLAETLEYISFKVADSRKTVLGFVALVLGLLLTVCTALTGSLTSGFWEMYDFVTYIAVPYCIIKVFSFIHSKFKIPTAALVVLRIVLVTAWTLLQRCLSPYFQGGVQIVEYAQKNGIDISQYREFFSEFGVDISSVFVESGAYSKGARGNSIPFRSMMAISVGEYFLRNNSFEKNKSVLLHEIGHARHFDAMYTGVLPIILAAMVMHVLSKSVKKTEKKSTLRSLMAVCAKISLFLFIAILIQNAISQICELRADWFACLHGGCSDLSKLHLDAGKRNRFLYYYPYTLLLPHPSYYHGVFNINAVVNGTVNVTRC